MTACRDEQRDGDRREQRDDAWLREDAGDTEQSEGQESGNGSTGAKKPATATTSPRSASGTGSAAKRSAAAGAPSSLGIPDYDELSASQVVDLLEGVSAAELDAIRDYESAHRARNTILGKIEQLQRSSD